MRPVDRLTLGYLAVVAVLVATSPARVDGALGLLLGFGACGALVVASAALARRLPENRLVVYVRVGIFPALTLFLYPAVERYALVLRGRFMDDDINTWESWAFGGPPNVLLDSVASPPLTEAMMACYFSFYLFALLPPLWLVARARPRDAERYLYSQMLAVYLCYLGFLLVPLRGPASALSGEFSTPHLSGYGMTTLQTLIMTQDPVGACFPSAHVATAWAGLLAMRRIISPTAFYTFLPLVCGITVAVVYNRYHYLSDALAGLAVAFVATAVGRRFEPCPPPPTLHRSSPHGHLRSVP
ncbi:phosphatase PAP2 family protein [Streptomyces sp. NPDC002928]|uniref:phosphatase PAP2 family protein n=1 Tax=Streptomyces sp. NPDC002928 TaxID=3154440 RepID=UPI0033A0E4CB